MRKILIAEDNVEISDMMKSYLEKAGHEVYQAFDGADALRKASEIKPDLALLDIMMPKIDGFTVCETLRKTMTMPIIVVSAKVAEEDKVRMFSSSRYEAKVDGEPLNLTAKEFKILDYLTIHENQIMPKQKLIDDVWGVDEYIDENTVAVTIARLRDKLSKVGISNVVTVWGLGYKWQD